MKQPVGATRLAVRAADYMNNALTLITSLKRRHKRSINATGWLFGRICNKLLFPQTFLMPSLFLDLLSDEDVELIARLTGCTPQHRAPSCKTTPNLNVFRTATNVCNNRWANQKETICLLHLSKWGVNWRTCMMSLTQTEPSLGGVQQTFYSLATCRIPGSDLSA